MSVVVGFKCDGENPGKPGFSEPCQEVTTITNLGSGYIAATESAKELEQSLKHRGWGFLGGYCYCPAHAGEKP